MTVREKRGVSWIYLQKSLFPDMPMYAYKRFLAKSIKEHKGKIADNEKGDNI
jgi:hypothetical protein